MGARRSCSVDQNFTMIQFKNKLQYVTAPGSRTVGPSETIPDDTLSIKQILAKHVRGMILEQEDMRTPIYQDDVDFDSPDLESVKRMDLADRHEYMQMLASENSEKLQRLKEVQEKAAQAKKSRSDAAGGDREGDKESDGHEAQADRTKPGKRTKDVSGTRPKAAASSGSDSEPEQH